MFFFQNKTNQKTQTKTQNIGNVYKVKIKNYILRIHLFPFESQKDINTKRYEKNNTDRYINNNFYIYTKRFIHRAFFFQYSKHNLFVN